MLRLRVSQLRLGREEVWRRLSDRLVSSRLEQRDLGGVPYVTVGSWLALVPAPERSSAINLMTTAMTMLVLVVKGDSEENDSDVDLMTTAMMVLVLMVKRWQR